LLPVPAEKSLDVGEEVVRPLASRDVAGDPFSADAKSLDDATGLRADSLHAARCDHDIHTLRGEALGDREADADAAPGDDGDLALEPEIHDPPFRLSKPPAPYQQV
jgi:hypothetical protein